MRIFNYKIFNESASIRDDDGVNQIVQNLSRIINDMRFKLLNLIEINSNIDVKEELDLLKDEFGEDVIRDLNIEALLRKLYQIISLKGSNIKERISNEIDSYLNSLESRLNSQKEISDDDHFDEFEGEYSILPRKKYEKEKFGLQVELMKLQEWVVKNNKKVAIVFEGRDSAGKGSTIKRFIEYMNPKYFRVVALGIPSEEERNNWFGRYENHLPKEGEIVFFDRSWYNRGVVEPVMGYCTEDQYDDFMDNVVNWEESLIRDGIILIKFWFSITKDKQQQRFKIRQESPLKYWKFSPNDAKVVDKFEMIGEFKNIMFQKTSTRTTPWVVINSNDKKIGRLNAIRYALDKIDYDDKDESKCKWYPEVVNVLL